MATTPVPSPSPSPSRSALPLRRKVAFAMVTTVALLGALEGLARLTERGPKYRVHPELGYELVPGYRGRRESVNALGLRGREVRAERTPGVGRVLCMGGSTTWGHKLAEDETWPAILEVLLRESGLAGVEVLNGGVSGWGAEQIATALERRRLDELRPDVVLVYVGWNDPRTLNAMTKRVQRGAAEAPERDLVHEVALARWLERKLDDLRGRGEEEVALEVVDWRALKAQLVPPAVAKAAGSCQRRGVAVAFVELASIVDAPLPTAADERAAYAAVLLKGLAGSPEPEAVWRAVRGDVDVANQAVREGAAAAAAVVLPTAAAMQSAASVPWHACFRDRMHLTGKGNALLAAAVAPWVRARLGERAAGR